MQISTMRLREGKKKKKEMCASTPSNINVHSPKFHSSRNPTPVTCQYTIGKILWHSNYAAKHNKLVKVNHYCKLMTTQTNDMHLIKRDVLLPWSSWLLIWSHMSPPNATLDVSKLDSTGLIFR